MSGQIFESLVGSIAGFTLVGQHTKMVTGYVLIHAPRLNLSRVVGTLKALEVFFVFDFVFDCVLPQHVLIPGFGWRYGLAPVV